MSNRDAIYDYRYRLEDAYKVLDRSSIDEDSKALVRAFVEQLRAQGVSIGRQAKYIFNLKVIGETLGMSYEEASRPDIERLMTRLREKGYTPNTTADYVMVVKRFYKFVRSGNVDKGTPFPPEVRWLRKTIKPNERRQPEMLTADEVTKMMSFTTRPRDRAMLAVAFEGGLRAAELLNLNVEDVTWDALGARIRVVGKTGERTVRLITSASALTRYFEWHTLGSVPDAPLWLIEATNRKNTRMGWNWWNRILKGLATKAGIKKRVHNHMLRHGSATMNAKNLSDSQLCYFCGWSPGSKMPGTYVHLSGQDLDERLAQVYGERPLEPAKPPA